MQETPASSSGDPSELMAQLTAAAERRHLSRNSRLAYERAWRNFLAWVAAEGLDPRVLPLEEARRCYHWLGEKRGAAALKQIRAALAFAYNHWDQRNPFAKIEPPIAAEPQVRYLMPADVRRLLEYLGERGRVGGYGAALAFQLANALFQTAGRFDELTQLQWEDTRRVGEEFVALRIKGKGSRFQDVPVPKALSQALLEWKQVQDATKAKRILRRNGIEFAASPFIFASASGFPLSNRAFNLRLRAACQALAIPVITAHGLRHSAATILLNHLGKDLREIQQVLRHRSIRTTVRYTHVGYEQTRATAEALSGILG